MIKQDRLIWKEVVININLVNRNLLLKASLLCWSKRKEKKKKREKLKRPMFKFYYIAKNCLFMLPFLFFFLPFLHLSLPFLHSSLHIIPHFLTSLIGRPHSYSLMPHLNKKLSKLLLHSSFSFFYFTLSFFTLSSFLSFALSLSPLPFTLFPSFSFLHSSPSLPFLYPFSPSSASHLSLFLLAFLHPFFFSYSIC